MNEIKCPKCGTVFQISESDYESIVKQIRDHEFEKEIGVREEQYKREKENAVKLAESNKDLEIQELRMKLSNSETGNTSSVNIQYQMNGMEIYFYPYDESDKEYIGGMADEVQSIGQDGTPIQTKILDTSAWDANGTPLAQGAFAGVTDSNHSKIYYI